MSGTLDVNAILNEEETVQEILRFISENQSDLPHGIFKVRYLFELDKSYSEYLKEGVVNPKLRAAFKEHKHELSDKVTISKAPVNSECASKDDSDWEVVDKITYLICDRNKGLTIYKIDETPVRKFHSLFCNNYPEFREKAGGTPQRASLLEEGFCAIAIAALFKKAGLNQKGIAVDIGGPFYLFLEALSMGGFSGTYVPLNIDENELEETLGGIEKKYGKKFKIRTKHADVLSLPKKRKCNLLLFARIIDDIFEFTFYNSYQAKVKEAQDSSASTQPWINEKPFTHSLYPSDKPGDAFWEYIKESITKPYIKKLFDETLKYVENETIAVCNMLETGGICMILNYPMPTDKPKIVKWNENALPKLVEKLEKSGFKLVAQSSEKTFLHPWFLLRKK